MTEKLINTLTTEEQREIDDRIEEIFSLINSRIMANYDMTVPISGNHFGSVMMCMRHLHALTSHVIWKANHPSFPDDGYWREKMEKLEEEFKTY